MEALATKGVPAVLSDIGPHQEILSVNPDGELCSNVQTPMPSLALLTQWPDLLRDRRQAA